MSWIEKVNTDFVIITGDGREYRPKWINAVKGIEYNVSEFNFVGLPGTYVDRREPRGRKFPIEIIFDGEDHLTIADQFEFSAKDKRPWRLIHPMYSTIICQPTSLNFDNSAMNVSRITGVLFETINLDQVNLKSVYPLQKLKNELKLASDVNVGKIEMLESLSVSDRKRTLSSITKTYNSVSKYLVDNEASSLYKNKFKELSSKLSGVTYDLVEVANSLHEYSVLPYTLIDDIDERLRCIDNQMKAIKDNLSTLFNRKSKRVYEAETGFQLIGITLGLLDNVGDYYENSVIITSVIDKLYSWWKYYMSALEEISTDHEGTPESFIPDYDLSQSINKIVSIAIAALMDMLTSAKQERIIYLSEDTPIINIVQKIYGLDSKDENLNKFMKQNNIGLGEILLLKKGRKIVYYI